MTLTLTKSKANKLLDQLTDLTLLERLQPDDALKQLQRALAEAYAADIERGDTNEFTVVIVEG